jgi:hypothetical protein
VLWTRYELFTANAVCCSTYHIISVCYEVTWGNEVMLHVLDCKPTCYFWNPPAFLVFECANACRKLQSRFSLLQSVVLIQGMNWLTTFLWYCMEHVESDAPNNSSGSCLLIHIHWRDNFLFTLTLVSNAKGYTYRYTDWMEEFMKYAFEMGLCTMIYVYTKFHKDWFWHLNVDTQRAWWYHKPSFWFFEICKVG